MVSCNSLSFCLTIVSLSLSPTHARTTTYSLFSNTDINYLPHKFFHTHFRAGPSCMNLAILWNFPDASNVATEGSGELQGSLLTAGNLHWKSGGGQSGRTMVLGNLIHDNITRSRFRSGRKRPKV